MSRRSVSISVHRTCRKQSASSRRLITFGRHIAALLVEELEEAILRPLAADSEAEGSPSSKDGTWARPHHQEVRQDNPSLAVAAAEVGVVLVVGWEDEMHGGSLETFLGPPCLYASSVHRAFRLRLPRLRRTPYRQSYQARRPRPSPHHRSRAHRERCAVAACEAALVLARVAARDSQRAGVEFAEMVGPVDGESQLCVRWVYRQACERGDCPGAR